jgi:VWFA-related protein
LTHTVIAMRTSTRFTSRSCFSYLPLLLLLCLMLVATARTSAQQRPLAPEQTDDVMRISTDLIQTDVMVFDRQGKFVDGLKPEQFELRVDGKPQAISFFERITAGRGEEDALLAAARGGTRVSTTQPDVAAKPLDRGRIIFFYLDDLHMAPDSVTRTRDSLTNFVEREMGQNDQVALITATGQLGILQQITSEKTVLLTAIKRLSYRSYDLRDSGRTPMTEFQALSIVRNNRSVIDYFVEQLAKEMGQPLQRRTARSTQPIKSAGGSTSNESRLEQMVIARARTMLEQANLVANNTLSTLEKLIRAAAPIPGRKLLFFISDGFFINEQTSQTSQKLPQISDAAARSGTVIYSIEARGLTSGLIPASEKLAYDYTDRLQAVETSAVTEAQQPLHKLAVDTGGRALLDTNAIAPGLSKALSETSIYYLLAWRPQHPEQNGGKFQRIEVSVKGQSDLMVRVRSGFLSEQPASASKRDASKGKSAKQKAEDSDLLTAIQSLYPKRALPTSLSIGYTNAATELLLTASVEVDGSVLSRGAPVGEQKSNVDLVGVLIDDRGKTVSQFEQRLTIDPSRMTTEQQRHLVYSHQMRVAPGLYQMRIATRDNQTARTGSASQWIEVPDLTRGGLSLGSLFIGEVLASNGGAQQQALINVNRRFARSSRLLFQTYIYNAMRGGAAPDVALQVQVFRDDQPVVTVPLRKVTADGVADLTRIPYEDDFALDGLPIGRYVLQVTAIDRSAKASASQRISFEVE